MTEVEYTESGQENLDLIAPLWKKLNDEHIARSEHFSDQFAARTFDKRKKDLLSKSESGSLHIGIAHDSTTGDLIGYCVSTILKDQGEIDTIYIEPDYRGLGTGDNLMKRALAWMDSNLVTKKVLVVAAGNEGVYTFYSRYGFYPTHTMLEQVQ